MRKSEIDQNMNFIYLNENQILNEKNKIKKV